MAGVTTLVSRTVASPVTAGNGDSVSPVISAHGRFVAFLSRATDLVTGQVDDRPSGEPRGQPRSDARLALRGVIPG